MATVERMSDERRMVVVTELARRLGRATPFFSEAAPHALAESFPCWVLDASAGEGSRIGECSRSASTWHHQVSQGEDVPMIARSLDSGQSTGFLLARSSLAAKVDRSITWADGNVDDAWLARLLFIPPLVCWALWLERGDTDRLYIVDAPTTLAEGQEAHPSIVLAQARLAAERWGPFAVDPFHR